METIVAGGPNPGELAPWIWTALALGLGLAGARWRSALVLSVALAALGCAALAWAVPAATTAALVAAFGIATLLLALVWRLRARPGEAEVGAALVGREARAVGFSFHEGRVTIDGVDWPARLDGGDRPPVEGERLVVIASDGRVVWVRRR